MANRKYHTARRNVKKMVGSWGAEYEDLLRILCDLKITYVVSIIVTFLVFWFTFESDSGFVKSVLDLLFTPDSVTYQYLLSNMYRIVGAIIVASGARYCPMPVIVVPISSFLVMVNNPMVLWVYYALSVSMYVGSHARTRVLTILCVTISMVVLLSGGSIGLLKNMSIGRISDAMVSDPGHRSIAGSRLKIPVTNNPIEHNNRRSVMNDYGPESSRSVKDHIARFSGSSSSSD